MKHKIAFIVMMLAAGAASGVMPETAINCYRNNSKQHFRVTIGEHGDHVIKATLFESEGVVFSGATNYTWAIRYGKNTRAELYPEISGTVTNATNVVFHLTAEQTAVRIGRGGYIAVMMEKGSEQQTFARGEMEVLPGTEWEDAEEWEPYKTINGGLYTFAGDFSGWPFPIDADLVATCAVLRAEFAATGDSAYVQLTETNSIVTIDAANTRTNTYGGLLSVLGSRIQGGNGTASGLGSIALGGFSLLSTVSLATNDLSFVWTGGSGYGSHGTGSFNINPSGGTDGFYIGSSSLATILSDAVAAEAALRVAGDLAGSNNVTSAVTAEAVLRASGDDATADVLRTEFAAADTAYVGLTETNSTVTIDAANARTNTYGGRLSILGNRIQAGNGVASGARSIAIGGVDAFDSSAIASNEYSFVWSSSPTDYGSHGQRTFNISPLGGTSGFYIGSSSLATILSDAVAAEAVLRAAGDSTNATAIATLESQTNGYLTAEADTLTTVAARGDFAGTETISPRNITMGGYWQALQNTGTSTIDAMAYGASQSGYNYETQTIGREAHGASQIGINNGIRIISDYAIGARQIGANAGTQSIGDYAIGASQIGEIELTATATNNAVGAIQIFALTAGQHALTTSGGKASIMLGAGVSSNKNAIVAGDGNVSNGDGSITATSFHGSGAALTGVTKPADLADYTAYSAVTNIVDTAVATGTYTPTVHAVATTNDLPVSTYAHVVTNSSALVFNITGDYGDGVNAMLEITLTGGTNVPTCVQGLVWPDDAPELSATAPTAVLLNYNGVVTNVWRGWSL